MQTTDKANREAQRNAAYESMHYACLQAIEAETVRYLPVLYIKPKKIRKPRAKKNKEPTKQHDMGGYWVGVTIPNKENRGARKKKLLFKYMLSVAIACIMLFINADKANSKNNSEKSEKKQH